MKKVWALCTGAMLLLATQALAQPDHAANVVVKALGTHRDPQTGRIVSGYAILDYRTGHAKPDHAGRPKNGGSSNCFTPLAKGATWDVAEPFIVDGIGSGLPAADVRAIMDVAAATWNAETSVDVFGLQVDGEVDALGIGLYMNGVNEVAFGPIAEPGVIAVTYVWGIFGGPPHERYLAEWDMKFNNADFTWSLIGAPGDMDFHNIAQHEMGHALGLGHPDNSCTEETMYAYADLGETKKRDLHTGDIAGAVDLY